MKWSVKVPTGRWMAGVHHFRTKTAAEVFIHKWSHLPENTTTGVFWEREGFTFVGTTPVPAVDGTTVVPPLLNINGTSVRGLLDGYCDVLRDLRAARKSMGETAPHGRDWQTSPDRSAFMRASQHHEARLKMVDRLIADYEALGEAVVDQDSKW